MLDSSNLSYRQTAQRLDVTPKTLRGWVKEGKFPQPFQINGKLLFSWEEIESYIIAQNPHLQEKKNLREAMKKALV